MESALQKWLDSDAPPADFYHLLGTQRFHPDRQHLLRVIRVANRLLHGFQNHPDPRKMQRARDLQMLLGQAEHTVSNDGAWHAYDDNLRQRLCDSFIASRLNATTPWRPEDVRRWLNVAQDVHPRWLDQMVQDIMTLAPPVPEADRGDDHSAPKTHQSQFFSLSDARPRSASLSTLNPAKPSPGPANRSPEVSSPVTSGVAASPLDPPPKPAVDPPPKPPARPGQRPPTPSAPTLLAPPVLRPGTTGGFPTIEPVRRQSASNQAVFWIVGSAVASALVMGVITVLFVFPRLAARDRAAMASTNHDVANQSSIEESGSTADVPPQMPAPKNPSSKTDVAQSGSAEDASVGDQPEPPSETDTTGKFPSPQKPTSDNPVSNSATSNGGKKSVPLTKAAVPKPANQPTSDSQLTPQAPVPQTPPTSNHGPIDLQHGKPVQAVAWNPNGMLIVTAGDDAIIRVWDLGGKEVKTLTGHGSTVMALAWAGTTGGYLASASDDGTIRIWDVDKGTETQTMTLSDRSVVNALAWAKDGKQLITGDTNGALLVWDPQTGKQQKKTMDQGAIAGAVRSLAPRNKATAQAAFVTGHVDGSVIAWNLARNPPILRLLLPSGGAIWEQLVTTGSLSTRNSGKVASSKNSSPPDVSSVAKRQHATPYGGERCFSVAVSSDDDFLALANGDLEIWDMSKPSASIRVRVLPGRERDDGFRTVAWSPDGHLIAGGDGAGEISVWDVRRWKVVFAQKYPGAITSIAWCPSGAQQLAVGCADGTTRVIPVGDGSSPMIQEPTFAAEEIVKKADEFAKDEDWGMLRRAVNLLDMYHLSSTDRAAIEKHHLRLKKAAEELLDSLSESSDSQATKPTSPKLPNSKSPSKAAPSAPLGRPAPSSQPQTRASPKNDFADRISSLQEVIDLDAEGKAGKKARQMLEKALE